jgi:hypothetical protein
MAILKKGFRKITVDENQFLWKVRKKISWNEIHNTPLGIPIQHANGGQLLIITIGFSRSYFEENNEFPITPSLIEKCIRKGIDSGWKYNEIGKQFNLDCSDISKEMNLMKE